MSSLAWHGLFTRLQGIVFAYAKGIFTAQGDLWGWDHSLLLGLSSYLLAHINTYLVGGLNPSEKYESQLG